MESPDQIILIDKPAGISSFGAVARVRRQLRDQFGRKVKVGHTGTLDPFATGLLILLSGKLTKKSADFLKLDKVYDATLKLGYTSSTGDPEGEITQVKPVSGHSAGCCRGLAREPREDGRERRGPETGLTELSHRRGPKTDFSETNPPTKAQIEMILANFIGEITQTVPKFSAVKIGGQRAYKLARAGQDFTPPTRKVTICNIELLSYAYPELKIRCHVSSGTYIRTLAEDIGKRLGTGAYLTALRRTKIGPYDIASAQKLKI